MLGVVVLTGTGVGLSAVLKAYGRAEERADANRVRLTHIAIRRAKQQARITRAQIEATEADADKRFQEAVGIRRAQDEISRALTSQYLQSEAIQAQKAVATSGRNNTLIYLSLRDQWRSAGAGSAEPQPVEVDAAGITCRLEAAELSSDA